MKKFEMVLEKKSIAILSVSAENKEEAQKKILFSGEKQKIEWGEESIYYDVPMEVQTFNGTQILKQK